MSLRGAFFATKQSPSGQSGLISGRLLRQKTARNDMAEQLRGKFFCFCSNPVKGERRTMMSPGRKDKAPKEPRRKPKLTIKEKRKLKKQKEAK
jgi:hypothetical protein